MTELIATAECPECGKSTILFSGKFEIENEFTVTVTCQHCGEEYDDSSVIMPATVYGVLNE